MQSFEIRAARLINKALGRTGKVFAFRYHATQIKTPRQARNALAYVLNNWRRHREDVVSNATRKASIDPYSSGIAFRGWAGVELYVVPDRYEPLPVADPQTWLLRVGWTRYPAIAPREVPGPMP